MDAEHRHELKQNDFIVYAKKTPDYIRKHWWESVCVVVIIVAVFMHFSKKSGKARPSMEKQAAVTSIYQDIAAAKSNAMAGEGSIDELDDLVKTLVDKSSSLKGAQAALAKVKAGDALRARLHYSEAMPSQDDIESHTTEAIILYEQAIEYAEGNATVEALASYGIALAKQGAGKFDEAATLYGQIIANAKFDKTPVVELAKDKLDGIAMAKQTFTFVEPTETATVEAVEQDTQIN